MSKIFLIEYSAGSFIDGLKVEWLEIKGGDIGFTLAGDDSTFYNVSEGFERKFLNSLQAINGNINSVESAYMGINN